MQDVCLLASSGTHPPPPDRRTPTLHPAAGAACSGTRWSGSGRRLPPCLRCFRSSRSYTSRRRRREMQAGLLVTSACLVCTHAPQLPRFCPGKQAGHGGLGPRRRPRLQAGGQLLPRRRQRRLCGPQVRMLGSAGWAGDTHQSDRAACRHQASAAGCVACLQGGGRAGHPVWARPPQLLPRHPGRRAPRLRVRAHLPAGGGSDHTGSRASAGVETGC